MRKYLFILFLALLAGCTREPAAVPEKLVIEGWIENGAAPVVYVSTTLRVKEGEKIGKDTVQDHIVKWGKVTISDGTESVILTGTASDRFFPPYAYTTGRMLGEVGKTYTITVEYSGAVATASATIPPPANLESITPLPAGSSGEFVLHATFTDNPLTQDYYRFFTRIRDIDKTYLPASLATLTDEMITSGKAQIDLVPGGSIYHTESRAGFRSGETVDVKFCTMQESMYRYWNAFEEQFALSRVPVFSLDANLPGNIKGDAIGYFAAYGATTCTVSIP